MNSGFDYTSIILDPFKKKNRIPAMLFTFFGISVLAVTLLSVAANFYVIMRYWPWNMAVVKILEIDNFINTVLRWSYVVGLASVIPFTIWFLKQGIKESVVLITRGVYDLRKPRYLGNIPADLFRSDKEREKFLYNSLKKKALSIYSPLDGTIGKLMTILIGERSGLIAPDNKSAVKKIGKKSWAHCKWFVGLLFTLFVSIWVYNQVDDYAFIKYIRIEILSDVIKILLNDLSTKIYLFLIILSSATAFIAILVDALMIKSLLPRSNIFTDCDQESVFLDGFGHPYQIVNRLPEISTTLQLNNDFPNRIYDKDMKFEKVKSMTDSGLAKGRIFIEEQPQYLKSQSRRGSYLFFIIGIIFCIGGFSFLFSPAFYYELLISGLPIEKQLIGAPLLIVMALFWARYTIMIGVDLIEHAYRKFNTFQFKSVGVLVEVEGSMGKADIKIGKSEIDSIGISDHMVRSDLKVEFFSAELISQSIGINGKRSIVSFNKSDSGKRWLTTIRKEIVKLHQEGVKTSIISTTSKQLRDVIDSNLLISNIRDQKEGNMIVVKDSENVSEKKLLTEESEKKEKEKN